MYRTRLTNPEPETKWRLPSINPVPFLLLAVLGMVLSLAAHVCSLLDIAVPSETMVLNWGIFVVWIPACMAYVRSTDDTASRSFWKGVLRGCPLWLKALVWIVPSYAFVNAYLVYLSGETGTVGWYDSSIISVRLFSGLWLAFYTAAFGILYSDWRVQRKAEDKPGDGFGE